MEDERIMKIIGLIIGILVAGAGLYYLSKEKNDKESRKIYSVVSIVGAAVALLFGALLVF